MMQLVIPSEHIPSFCSIEEYIRPPKSWYQIIRHKTSRGKEKSKADMRAIAILSAIVSPVVLPNRNNAHSLSRYHINADDNLFELLASSLGDTKRCMRSSWATLVDSGVIEKLSDFTPQEVQQIIVSKTPHLTSIQFNQVCEWCKCKTPVLHRHHYPVLKSKGGIETVDICPNCHAEFHYLMDTPRYRFTQKLINSITGGSDGE